MDNYEIDYDIRLRSWSQTGGTDILGGVLFCNSATSTTEGCGAGVKGVTSQSGWNSTDIEFHTGPNGAMTEKMVILSNGNVGIGTINPDDLLHVSGGDSGGSTHGDSKLIIEHSGPANIQIDVPSSSFASLIFGYPGHPTVANRYAKIERDNEGQMNFYVNGTEAITIGDDSGSICGPDSDLSDCASDIRLKENVVDYGPGLDEVLQLRPVTFDWNSEGISLGMSNGARNVGLVAQEVEGIVPEWVNERGDGYKKVDGTGELKFALVNAVQELKTQLDEKDSEIQLLKEDLCYLGIQRWC